MPKSPFPGMDPYLESHWLDVHTKLVAYGADAMNTRLPDDLAASTEERVAVESDEAFQKRFHPDVQIFEPHGGIATVTEASTNVMTSAPVRLVVLEEPVTERSLRIVETGTERLVTVIEFLSPSSKQNPGIKDFRAKRAQLLAAGVNFVEIDLIREGDWQALLRPHYCPPKLATAYRALIRTPDDPAGVGLYPIPLRLPLPSIVIPLRSGDPEVRLDLQPLVDLAYSNGRYARRLDYRQPPAPPLEPADQKWACSIHGME